MALPHKSSLPRLYIPASSSWKEGQGVMCKQGKELQSTHVTL